MLEQDEVDALTKGTNKVEVPLEHVKKRKRYIRKWRNRCVNEGFGRG